MLTFCDFFLLTYMLLVPNLHVKGDATSLQMSLRDNLFRIQVHAWQEL